MQLKPVWIRELLNLGPDTVCGVPVCQLTSQGVTSHNIYCEQRYTSLDSTTIAFVRDPYNQPSEMWICDLTTRRIAKVDDLVRNEQGGASSVAGTDGDNLYYMRGGDNGQPILMRLDFKTLEIDEICSLEDCPTPGLSSMSPTETFAIHEMRLSIDTWGLYRIDLANGKWEVFHEQKDMCNSHAQFEPSKGDKILVQLNRGCIVNEEGDWILGSGPNPTLYIIDADGSNQQMLPIGAPHTRKITGHEAWIADTGNIIFDTSDPVVSEIHTLTPGDASPRTIASADNMHHVNASFLDGRCFVTDDFNAGRVMVGSIKTGRMLPLCDTGPLTVVGPQYSHPHGYMTPDNTKVIFNSARTGTAQIYLAEIPPDMIGRLEEA